jgi:hypothetical protein
VHGTHPYDVLAVPKVINHWEQVTRPTVGA